MNIEIDFIQDIHEELAEQLRQLGYTPRKPTGAKYDDAHTMFMDHAHALGRRISAMPRYVRLSRELILREPSLPGEIRGGIMAVAYDLMLGHDVTPRLSRKLKKRDGKDDLLLEWGIHHLHLSSVMEADGFTVHADDVIFALVRTYTAYLIDVRPHGAWADDELVEIVHANWPYEIAPFKYNAVRLAHNITPEQRLRLRSRGGNAPFQTKDGTIYGPIGGGMVSTRKSLRSVTDGDSLLREAQNVESYLQEHTEWLTNVVAEQIGSVPDRVRLQLVELEPDHALVLVKNGVKDFAFRLPIEQPVFPTWMAGPEQHAQPA